MFTNPKKTLTVLPFLVGFLAALAWLPLTNVVVVNAHEMGIEHAQPWRRPSAGGFVPRFARATTWVKALLQDLWGHPLRGPALAAAAVALAVSVGLDADQGGLLFSITAIPGLAELKTKRVTLLDEARALGGADGKTFKDDAARTAFDQAMAKVEAIDQQLVRGVLAEEPAPGRLTLVPPVASPDAATTAERERCIGIRQAVRAARLTGGDELVDELIRNNTSLDSARALILERLSAQDNLTRTDGTLAVLPGEDARDKWVRGASAWLVAKSGAAALLARAAGVTVDKLDQPGEFRGMTFLDLARASLERDGVKVRGLSKMELAGLALSYRSITQGTSDFATLLENTMHRVLQAAYATTPDTWSKWCARGTVSDFRAHNRYRFGMFGTLDALNEQGEFKTKAITDAEKASITATTKGNIITISRQAIVNDDMDAFGRLVPYLGRAARLSVEVAAYAELAKNSGLGPTQADAQALFHSNRLNVGSGSAIAAAALDADRVIMAQQKEPNGNEYLDLRPAILLLPVGLGGQARVINQSQYDPDTVANKSQMKPNVVVGLFRDVVDTPRLSGTRRYLFADPSIAPVFEVAFLEGEEEPVLETRDGWSQDGVEVKVRHDFGVAAVDFRGAVTNAGA